MSQNALDKYVAVWLNIVGRGVAACPGYMQGALPVQAHVAKGTCFGHPLPGLENFLDAAFHPVNHGSLIISVSRSNDKDRPHMGGYISSLNRAYNSQGKAYLLVELFVPFDGLAGVHRAVEHLCGAVAVENARNDALRRWAGREREELMKERRGQTNGVAGPSCGYLISRTVTW